MKLTKYYHQRHRYFSLFDEGIQMDEEGWYSVTPELIAQHTALYFHEQLGSNSDLTVVDAFCGVGGNTIQFARVFKRVIAIELNAQRLEMARHNAQIYGVADRIEFLCGDFLDLFPSLESVDAVFLSPPWGGPEYLNLLVYPLSVETQTPLQPLPMKQLLEICQMKTRNVSFFLPRNIDLVELVDYVLPSSFDSFGAVIEQHSLNGRAKALSVHFGLLARRR